MIAELNPGLVMILGAILVPILRGKLRTVYALALPILALFMTLGLEHGASGQMEAFGLSLTTLRVDELSLVFAYIFLIAAILGVLYSAHLDDAIQQVAGLVYAGSSVGAVFAGDLVTLFVFWEATSIASVFLIWASRTPEAINSGMRYLVFQVGSGVLLLGGAIVAYGETGSIAFGEMDIGTIAGLLLFAAFGIKAAFPLLHTWLPDAYPRSTVTGGVFLSVFTTKLAIFALARSFAGTELLIPIGMVMAIVPLFFGLLANDLRRALAYTIINQLGFMLVGIGIGSEMSLNGMAAHAFAHILYDALFFMAMGAVLYRTGTMRASDLGGLYRSMPWTAAFCLVASASIAAVPLFSGFVTKSMIVDGAAEEGMFWAWLVLYAASAGVFIQASIRIPYAAFFGRDRGLRVAEAPPHMLVAMGATAAACIGIGLFPAFLHGLLPYEVDFHAYTAKHILTQLQILMFAALAFIVLMRAGLYPRALPSTSLDSDWLYRSGGRRMAVGFHRWLSAWRGVATSHVGGRLVAAIAALRRYHGPEGVLGGTWPTGVMTFWTTVLLAGLLLAYYV